MTTKTILEQTRSERVSSFIGSTACIVRAFNNEFVKKQVENLLTIGVGLVVVVVDQKRDGSDCDTKKEHLKGYVSHPRVKIEYVQENFSWSVALNWGVRTIKVLNRVHGIRTGSSDPLYKFVFNVSVEAKFKREHVITMLEQFDLDSKIGTVGTTWRGKKNGNLHRLGWTYERPRNTGSIWRIGVFNDIEFDPWCDYCVPVAKSSQEKKLGGMEDFDAMLRAYIFSSWKSVTLDLQVELVIGVIWKNQLGKEQREQNATREILKRLRRQFDGDSYESCLVDEAIKACNLNLE